MEHSSIEFRVGHEPWYRQSLCLSLYMTLRAEESKVWDGDDHKMHHCHTKAPFRVYYAASNNRIRTSSPWFTSERPRASSQLRSGRARGLGPKCQRLRCCLLEHDMRTGCFCGSLTPYLVMFIFDNELALSYHPPQGTAVDYTWYTIVLSILL